MQYNKIRMKKITYILTLVMLSITGCKDDKKTTDNNEKPTLENTFGYGILNKVKGIWAGPVTSTTALGGYPEWVVDFRPIADNQVSAKNELDTLNDIHMSFFITRYKDAYKVAFRNGGSFAGMKRVSYFLADSVAESSTESYYRFSEVIKGKSRAYTEVIFKSDSMIVNSYTNKYNAQATASPHMSWRAKLQDTTSTQPAVAHFSFPKKTLAKDFSTSFDGQQEAVYYTLAGDPYTENQQPYLGQTTVNYSFASSYAPNPARKVFLLITTKPLINGFSLDLANWKTRSRYVILSSNDQSYTFNYMHPGSYYLYALYDNDGNNNVSSGDWVSATNTTFSLSEQGSTTASTQINFTIP
jgi:hypothetical protein